MAGSSITSSNSVFQLSAGTLYPQPVLMKQYTADRAFASEDADIAEVAKGVDNNLYYGWVPRLYVQTIMFAPNSPSVGIFENIVLTEDSLMDKIPLAATIVIPALSRKYTFNNGILSRYTPFPSAARVMEPRGFTITWDTVVPSPSN